MGHVEPDGAASGQTRSSLKPGRSLFRSRQFWRAGGATPHPVWPVWWALKHEFALWRAPASWFGTPGSWTYFGNDFVTGLRRNDSTAKAFAILDAAPDQFAAVTALAHLNVRRHEQMFQFVVLLYVSVPVTVLLGLAEVMPDGLIAVFSGHPFVVWYVIGLLTVGVLGYLVGLWRARQLVSVAELWRIERSSNPV